MFYRKYMKVLLWINPEHTQVMASCPGYKEQGCRISTKSLRKYILEKIPCLGIFLNSEKCISSTYRSPTIMFTQFSIKHLPNIHKPFYLQCSIQFTFHSKLLNILFKRFPKITKYPSPKLKST